MRESLFEGHCESCESGQGILKLTTVNEALDALRGWDLAEDENSISRTFSFDNFHQTMAFVNAVAWIAHTEDHHPDMEVTYNSCGLTYTTHAAGGLTKNDFICAAAVNRLLRDEDDES